MTEEVAGIALLAGLLFIKEAGVPIPVPGDLLVLGAGVAASRGETNAVMMLAAILGASVLGGLVQFLIVRGRGRRVVLGLLARLGASADRLERHARLLRKRGTAAVAVSRMTPGVRVIAIAASGLASLPVITFLAGLAIGNTVFLGGHFVAGFVVGEPARRFFEGTLGQLAAVGLILAAAGAVGWLLVRRLRSRRHRADVAVEPPVSGIALLADWADAACPACLALAIVAPSTPER